MPIHLGRFLQIGIPWNYLTIAPSYRYDFDIFAVLVKQYLYVLPVC